MRAVAMWFVAFVFAFAAGVMLLGYVMLELDAWRERHHKPVSEYKAPPRGAAPGGRK